MGQCMEQQILGQISRFLVDKVEPQQSMFYFILNFNLIPLKWFARHHPALCHDYRMTTADFVLLM